MSTACKRPSAFSFVIGATALLLAGCTNGQQQVSGHRYDVPAANLVPESSYPFFLPKSKDDGFIFIINPEAELRQQRTVLVQDREEVCRRANGGGYVSRTICAPENVEWQGYEWTRSGGDTFWTYSPNAPSGVNAPFVSCHKMEIKGHPGLCSATLAFNDLVLKISLSDDELPTLEATYQQATSMLRSWES